MFPNFANFVTFGPLRFHASHNVSRFDAQNACDLDRHQAVKATFEIAVITDIGMACLEYLRNGIVRGHIPGGLDVVQKICCCFCFHDEWVLVFTGS